MTFDSAILPIPTEHEAAPAARYGDPVVRLEALGARVIVLSDLHMGAGIRPDGRSDGSKTFVADAAFARFLEWACTRAHGSS